MKKLLLLALLAGCTAKGPDYTPDQQKIIKLAQHLEPDSARYVPLRFSRPTPFTRADSVRPTIDQYTEMSDGMASLAMASAKLVDLQTQNRVPAVELTRSKRKNDSISNAYQAIMASRLALLRMGMKSIVVGQEIVHSWRVGERVDSAHFVVFKNGIVKRI